MLQPPSLMMVLPQPREFQVDHRLCSTLHVSLVTVPRLLRQMRPVKTLLTVPPHHQYCLKAD